MRNKLLYFADSYTYLLYYYRLFIVTWIEDFSTIICGFERGVCGPVKWWKVIFLQVEAAVWGSQPAGSGL